ncbi:helix-turn-helix domain-containing protein [Streptomyces sp. MNP-20]|uniref:helix-turn-helix domain-containing protein n=1 Tax=Streptomyces sp. MNP-20 TaxID=2721165 RepID=UPI00155772EB|nr:helix-turn-helix transcriptional regulator [Streptomyces sp. MNP-20]
MKKPTGREVEPKDRAFGARVKAFRVAKGLTQAQLAATVGGKTSSWMSQVERGIQPVERLDVLQDLADALEVSLQQLRPGEPTLPEGTPPPVALKSNDLDEARRLISGHPAVGTLLATEPQTEPRPLDELAADVDTLWDLTHAGQLPEVSALVVELVPELERAVRTVRETQRPTAYLLLARLYQALAAAFGRQDQADAAWVAADRAINAAERSGHPLQVCVGIFRLVHAFVRLRHLDQAEHAATSAIQALQRMHDPSPETMSVLGSLHLALALAYARGSQRSDAKVEIDQARQIARNLGEDRTDFNLEFGPTNVEIQAVSTAVELGDAGEALEIGCSINATSLSPERQSRLLMDLGRAHVQRRHPGDALSYLLRAEKIAPETIRTHMAARTAVKELLLIAGATPSAELLALAERVDALE